MLYSYNPEQEKKHLFLIFLQDAIKGNEKYSAEVNKVLQEVKDLCTEKKTIYNIDRTYFDIIAELAGRYTDFYSKLDINNLDRSKYEQIRTHLLKLDNLVYA